MPASMIIALAGFMRKVSGSSIAIVAGGPRPGITPTTVPSTTPRKHHSRFIGSRATANPCSRPERTSTLGELHAEREREHGVERRRANDGDGGRHPERPSVHHRHDEESQRRERDQEPGELERRNRRRQRGPSTERAPGAGPVDSFFVFSFQA